MRKSLIYFLVSVAVCGMPMIPNPQIAGANPAGSIEVGGACHQHPGEQAVGFRMVRTGD